MKKILFVVLIVCLLQAVVAEHGGLHITPVDLSSGSPTISSGRTFGGAMVDTGVSTSRCNSPKECFESYGPSDLCGYDGPGDLEGFRQDVLNIVFEKVNTEYGSIIYSLGDESEESTDLDAGYHIGRFNHVQFLPVPAYGVAINFGTDSVRPSIYCGDLSTMEQTENTMYVLVFSLEDYACSGQLRVMPSEKTYTLPGEKECITDLSNGRYDTNDNGKYDLEDIVAFLRWSLAHRLNSYSDALYPLDAAEIETSGWGS